MRVSRKELEQIRERRKNNVVPLRKPAPAPAAKAPTPAPQPKPVAKESKSSSDNGEALRAIADALKEQIKRQPEPVTFKFDISRDENGKISGITATPVKS